jgi:hypothetical protein
MRRFAAAALVAASAFTMLPSQAAEGDRTVEGNILVPTTRDSESLYFAPPPGPIAKHARCTYLLAKEATGDGNTSNGLVGWHVDMPEAFDGGWTFTLEASAGNVGIYFYEDLATCEGNAASSGESTDSAGNEAGEIPIFTSHAIIVVEDAADVDFTLKMFAPEN